MNSKIRKIHRPLTSSYQKLNNPRIVKDHAEYIKAHEEDVGLVFVPFYSMVYYSFPPFKTSKPMYKKVK